MANKVKTPRLRSYGEPGLSAASVKCSYLPDSSGASATPRNASPARAERIVTNLSRKRDTHVESIGRMPSEGFLAILGERRHYAGEKNCSTTLMSVVFL